MTQAEAQALADARECVRTDSVTYTDHALERMAERKVRHSDVLSAIQTARSCLSQRNGSWRVCGLDTFGDTLTVVMVFVEGALVITVF